MPVVHPAEVWKESGRYYKIGPELLRFKDRTDRDMVLAMTHEEIVAILLRDLVQSYRQLPMIVYHFQTKFRDEPRSRGGLIRVREFVMKDAYSCDLDDAGPRRELPEALGRLRRGSSSASGSRRSSSARTSGSWAAPGPTSSWSSTTSARTPWSCATAAATPTTSRSRSSASPTRSPRTPSRWRTSRRRRDDDRRARDVPRHPEVEDGEGRILRDRRWPVRRRDRPRRLRRQRDEARQHGQGTRRPATGDRRGDQGAGHGGRLRLAARCPRRDGRRRRARRPLAEPRRRREPRRVAREERQRAARLHARPRRRDHECPRRRPLPDVRLAGEAPQGHRGRQHLQARDGLHRTHSGRCTSARTASATRS